MPLCRNPLFSSETFIDGPALRAITAVTYANHLLSGGGDSEKKYVNDVIWRMIEPDLAYVAKFWNRTT
jgi:glucoamylase